MSDDHVQDPVAGSIDLGPYGPLGRPVEPPADRCWSTMFGIRCVLDRRHEGDHQSEGGVGWTEDVMSNPAVSIEPAAAATPDGSSPMFGVWWIYRSDGEDLWGEYTFLAGGVGVEPSWSEMLDGEIEALLSEEDYGGVVFVATRLDVVDDRIRVSRASLTVAPPAEVSS